MDYITINKNRPVSKRKAAMYDAMVAIYKVVTESEEYDENLNGELGTIANNIFEFSTNGAYLPPFKVSDFGDSALGAAVKKLLPRHKRKRALFTNLAMFVKLVGDNDLEDKEVNEQVKSDLSHWSEELESVCVAAMSGTDEGDTEDKDETDYKDEDEKVRGIITLEVELGENYSPIPTHELSKLVGYHGMKLTSARFEVEEV